MRMLIPISIILSAMVITIGTMNISVFKVPRINEFPSESSMGRYFFIFGKKLNRYNARTTPPVAIRTPVFVLKMVENKIINEIFHKPNNHQQTAENIILCATELSQKYELYTQVIPKQTQ